VNLGTAKPNDEPGGNGSPGSNHVLRLNDIDYPAKSATMHFRHIQAQGPMTSSVYKMEDKAGGQTNVMHLDGTVASQMVRFTLYVTANWHKDCRVLEF
jgi:hypothetical protein